MACNPRPPRLSWSGSQPSATRFLPHPRKKRGQEGQPTKMFNSPWGNWWHNWQGARSAAPADRAPNDSCCAPHGGFWTWPLDRERRLPAAAHRAADCELSRGTLGRTTFAVDDAESSHGADPGIWRRAEQIAGTDADLGTLPLLTRASGLTRSKTVRPLVWAHGWLVCGRC